MPVRQLYYTCCRHGLSSGSGFQIRAASPGIDPGDREQVIRLGLHKPLPATPEATPLAFRAGRLASGRTFVQRSRYLGTDYSGREGNFFTHSLIADDMLPLWAVDYYEWPHWIDALRPEEDDRAPDALPVVVPPSVPPGDSFSYPELGLFLREVPERASRLQAMLGALLAPHRDRKPLIIRDEKENNPFWIACLTKALPRRTAGRLRFSTFQCDPVADLDIMATVPNSDFVLDAELLGNCTVFDLTGRTEPNVGPAEGAAAGYACRMVRLLRDFPEDAAAFTAYMEHADPAEPAASLLAGSLDFFEHPTCNHPTTAPGFRNLPILLETLLRAVSVRTPEQRTRLGLVWAAVCNEVLRSVLPDCGDTAPTPTGLRNRFDPETLLRCGLELAERAACCGSECAAAVRATLDTQTAAEAVPVLNEAAAALLLLVAERCAANPVDEVVPEEPSDPESGVRPPSPVHCAFARELRHRPNLLPAVLHIRETAASLLQQTCPEEAGNALFLLGRTLRPDRIAALRRLLDRHGAETVLATEWKHLATHTPDPMCRLLAYLSSLECGDAGFVAGWGLSCLMQVLHGCPDAIRNLDETAYGTCLSLFFPLLGGRSVPNAAALLRLLYRRDLGGTYTRRLASSLQHELEIRTRHAVAESPEKNGNIPVLCTAVFQTILQDLTARRAFFASDDLQAVLRLLELAGRLHTPFRALCKAVVAASPHPAVRKLEPLFRDVSGCDPAS